MTTPLKPELNRRSLLKLGASLLLAGTSGGIAAQGLTAQGVTAHGLTATREQYPLGVRGLVFDIFGTVVDWRSSIIREGQLLGRSKGFDLDWGEFADKWRAGYTPAMNQVRSGELPWLKLDDLHRMVLEQLIEEYALTGLTEADIQHLNFAWHRLSPWSDSIAGLNRLRNKYVVATLSNGNVSLLVNLSKNAGLTWDTVLSAELSGHYKPDPEAYLKAPELLGLRPDEVMLVAAHPSDLRGAAAAGLRTAYVHRPLERGPQRVITPPAHEEFDFFANDFLDLAGQLGA